MKKLVIMVAAVLALVVAVTPVALAGPGKAKPGQGQGDKVGLKQRASKRFTANGVVRSVAAEDGTFTMKVWSGGKMRSERGKLVTIKVVADSTKIFRVVAGERSDVTLADMKAGERVWVQGTFVKTDDGRVYTAKRVKLKGTWPFMAKGVVTDVGDATITVEVTRSMVAMRAWLGEEIVLQIGDATRLLKRVDGVTSPITLADIAIDDKVTVNGLVDNTQPTDKEFIARRVLVRD